MAGIEECVTQLERSRNVVTLFCKALSDRRFDEMRRLTVPAMRWFVPGLVARVDFAGSFDFQDMLPKLEAFLGSMDAFQFDVRRTIAEQRWVAVEATSHGVLNGVVYDNVYLMQFEVDGDKIVALSEFLDQSSVADFMERLAAAQART